MSETVPVVFDTDIGTDIDDAVALAYLLKQPRCELLGITTVTGEARKRAALADAVCQAAGRTDVPIFSGAEQPLLDEQRQPTCEQAKILAAFPHRPPEAFTPNEAVGFLRRLIRERPGEVTLLATGPLTNIGLLFALDREIPRLLKRLVVMCGVFGVGASRPGLPLEHNACCDATATAILYSPRGLDHLSIGLDVTLQCHVPNEECLERFGRAGGPLDVVAAATRLWARWRPQIVFHDPLAAAVIFSPDLVQTQAGLVEIELQDTKLRGLTRWQPQAAAQNPHRVATSVDPAAFFTHYFDVVGG